MRQGREKRRGEGGGGNGREVVATTYPSYILIIITGELSLYLLAAHALSGANSLAQEKHFHSMACVCVEEGDAGEVNGSCLNLSILFCHIVFLCHVCRCVLSRSLSLSLSLGVCSDLKVPLSLANLLYLRWHSLTFCVSLPCPPLLLWHFQMPALCCLSLCLFLPAVRVYYWYLLNEWIVRAPRHSHIFAHALHEA